jgi:hypothetical protein
MIFVSLHSITTAVTSVAGTTNLSENMFSVRFFFHIKMIFVSCTGVITACPLAALDISVVLIGLSVGTCP